MPNVNNMEFVQSATLLTAIVNQATGKTGAVPTNTSDFVSVAQTGLKAGYDALNTAISQVLGRTIFSIRPYYSKFNSIMVDSDKWGAVTRKINYIDGELMDDDRLKLANGDSIDQQIVQKPKALQTNFYGAQQVQKMVTIYKDQLDVAFTNPTEFSQFISGVMSNVSDQLEQTNEAFGRETLMNFIAGKSAGDSSNVIHLITTYNTLTGASLTTQTAMKPENFTSVIRWVYGYIQSLVSLMEERTLKYHINVTGSEILRHTPRADLRAFFNAQLFNQIGSSVLSNLFHTDEMKMIPYEEVNFWQSIDSPTNISTTPTYLATNGNLATAGENVVLDNVVGVLFDKEALGMTRMSTWSSAAPFNARGGYQNTFWHQTLRSWNDFTENAIVLCFD